jgi:hypothetical protein
MADDEVEDAMNNLAIEDTMSEDDDDDDDDGRFKNPLLTEMLLGHRMILAHEAQRVRMLERVRDDLLGLQLQDPDDDFVRRFLQPLLDGLVGLDKIMDFAEKYRLAQFARLFPDDVRLAPLATYSPDPVADETRTAARAILAKLCWTYSDGMPTRPPGQIWARHELYLPDNLEDLMAFVEKHPVPKVEDEDFDDEELAEFGGNVMVAEFHRHYNAERREELGMFCSICRCVVCRAPSRAYCCHRIWHVRCVEEQFLLGVNHNCPDCRKPIPVSPMSRQDALNGLLRLYEESLQRCEYIFDSAMSDSSLVSAQIEDPHNLVVDVFHELSAPDYDLRLPAVAIHADTFSATSLQRTLNTLHDIAGDVTKWKPYDIVSEKIADIRGERITAGDYAARVVSDYRGAKAKEAGKKKKKVVRSEVDEQIIEETNRLCDDVCRLLHIFFKTNTV